mmetsp:Transcript_20834/g.45151  ORF Transcript_20834/g.45151 Transcript_20834/m.45151 type:complete len:408 (-) Transcript_20834:180-1403(-)|eukprot:CAMPEP_0168720266 /NCGR_PEP_ID=MMETSP0724-20121128/1470_1 /TAXON_ID=265536 /ORGANISM="Amphiprora sp., Strain CCMP467" /LENGTH=407 /DNA_ID=CAMNT_0008766855 /DNA_START=43 /DNA_END=1266 /DNA_ORIENTATION=+
MDRLTQVINTAVPAKDYGTLSRVFSDHFGSPDSWQSVGQGEQRSLAAHFIVRATSEPGFLPAAFSSAEMMRVMTSVLGHLPATVDNAADNQLRQLLFDYLISGQDGNDPDFSGAARVLAGMRMEADDTNNVYYMSAANRTDVFVRQAECFLAEDSIAESDAATQKAGAIVESIPNKEQHLALILRYKSTYARVLDSNRKFLAAAQRYHELSSPANEQLIDADDLLQMLGRAATCAILAPSGPLRARVLGHIYQDARLARLDSLPEFQTHGAILRKMHRHMLLPPQELQQFEASLADHQKALMGDGLTIMERGVVEHNMIAVSQLYQSIYLQDLARILGVTVVRAESIAATMIVEGSLQGTLDQVEQLLILQGGGDNDAPEDNWDRSITGFCLELNRTVDAVSAASSG